MAWSPPRTWSPGETVTASLMNAHVRDNLNALNSKAIVVVIGDPTGPVISTGVKVYIEIPMKLKVTGWTILANQSGSIVVDVWKDTYANFPPTAADSIAGSEKPTLSSQQKNQDLALTTWSTTTIDAGDVLAFNVDSVSGVKQVVVTLRVETV
jgi:hypothetical protein